MPSAVGVQSLNHWTAREVLKTLSFCKREYWKELVLYSAYTSLILQKYCEVDLILFIVEMRKLAQRG